MSKINATKCEEAKALALTWNMGAASLPPEEYVQLEAIIKNISSTRNIDNECMADWQIKISGKEQHDSDCETSNAPAMIPGPCDCDPPIG